MLFVCLTHQSVTIASANTALQYCSDVNEEQRVWLRRVTLRAPAIAQEMGRWEWNAGVVLEAEKQQKEDAGQGWLWGEGGLERIGDERKWMKIKSEDMRGRRGRIISKVGGRDVDAINFLWVTIKQSCPHRGWLSSFGGKTGASPLGCHSWSKQAWLLKLEFLSLKGTFQMRLENHHPLFPGLCHCLFWGLLLSWDLGCLGRGVVATRGTNYCTSSQRLEKSKREKLVNKNNLTEEGFCDHRVSGITDRCLARKTVLGR